MADIVVPSLVYDCSGGKTTTIGVAPGRRFRYYQKTVRLLTPHNHAQKDGDVNEGCCR
jgi:hypothetical protein